VSSDSGREFINHQVWQWRRENGVGFYPGQSLPEKRQLFSWNKKTAAVSTKPGYYRYDTDEEAATPAKVYHLLCPRSFFDIPQSKSRAKSGWKTAS
jgi:hypothetical protein